MTTLEAYHDFVNKSISTPNADERRGYLFALYVEGKIDKDTFKQELKAIDEEKEK